MGANELTRRGFVEGAGLTPLFVSAATIADARAIKTAPMGNPDPYSYVDPELAGPLRNWPGGFDAPNASNLASMRAGDGPDSSKLNAPELQPRNAKIPGRAGAADIPVLIIDPKLDQKNKPAVLYIHGGGYVLGSADGNLRTAQDIAHGTDSLVVSVDYTLAPEAKFPISLEQNYAALAWLHKNAGQLGVDVETSQLLGGAT
jgi:acetyl esterase/lipase